MKKLFLLSCCATKLFSMNPEESFHPNEESPNFACMTPPRKGRWVNNPEFLQEIFKAPKKNDPDIIIKSNYCFDELEFAVQGEAEKYVNLFKTFEPEKKNNSHTRITAGMDPNNIINPNHRVLRSEKKDQ